MQRAPFSCIQRRLYHTFDDKNPTVRNLPRLAAVARTASTPLAVRRRRQLRRGKNKPALGSEETDANANGLTPSDLARYNRLRTTGGLGTANPVSEKTWIEAVNSRRSRLRGVKRELSKEDGQVQVKDVVGTPIYLPNVVFRLVRNHTKPGEPYNPYEATFRIPQGITKTDVRSYLKAVYGVETTYIRTDNYISPLYNPITTTSGKVTRSYRTYKRAVVGLVEPFYYPQRMEDLEAKEKEEREKYIETNFQPKALEALRRMHLLRMTKKSESTTDDMWRWRGPATTKRSTILKLIAEKRAQREGLIADQVKEWQEKRAIGEPISFE